MKKEIAKDARITESMIKTARIIFGSSNSLGIIFLLTRMKMSPQKIEAITGCSEPFLFYYIAELESMGIIEREYQILVKAKVGGKGRAGLLFKINKDIRDDLVQIINSFLKIQDVLEKYRQNAVLEKYKKEKEFKAKLRLS